MKNRAWIQRQTKTPEARKRYEEERLILRTTEAIARAMEEQGLSQAGLADLLGVSAAHVSQLLSGSRNMTLRTLAGLGFACGMRTCVGLEPLREGEFISQPVKLLMGARPRFVELEGFGRFSDVQSTGTAKSETSPLAA